MIHSPSFRPHTDPTFEKALTTMRFGRKARFYKTTNSTNVQAMALARQNAPDGALVVADFQTQGRGRQGRHWEASEAQNLLFSLVLRPNLPPTRWGLLTIAASLAIKASIDTAISPIEAKIKWPNDILIGDKKCCGMLTEAVTTAGSMTERDPVVLGIGINVNQVRFSEEVDRPATSLLLESGRHTPRLAFLASMMNQFEQIYDGRTC